jgi:hypothetical protein
VQVQLLQILVVVGALGALVTVELQVQHLVLVAQV